MPPKNIKIKVEKIIDQTIVEKEQQELEIKKKVTSYYNEAIDYMLEKKYKTALVYLEKARSYCSDNYGECMSHIDSKILECKEEITKIEKAERYYNAIREYNKLTTGETFSEYDACNDLKQKFAIFGNYKDANQYTDKCRHLSYVIYWKAMLTRFEELIARDKKDREVYFDIIEVSDKLLQSKRYPQNDQITNKLKTENANAKKSIRNGYIKEFSIHIVCILINLLISYFGICYSISYNSACGWLLALQFFIPVAYLLFMAIIDDKRNINYYWYFKALIILHAAFFLISCIVCNALVY